MKQRVSVRSRSGIDGIGCAGIAFLLLLVSSAGMAWLRPEAPAEVAAVDALEIVPAVPAYVTRITATPQSSATPLAAPVDEPRTTATATLLPPPTETAGPTPTASPTPLPPTPTRTPLPLPTRAPLPLPTLTGEISRTVRVPILMYHYVSTPPEDADEYRLDLSVDPAAFREQMAFLADNGYTAIGFYELSAAIANKAPLPPNPVIITFDDGHRDAYENAYPILRHFGLRATFFIITDFVDRGLAEHLTWPMIEEMAAAGMDMEPHTKTHEDLRERSHDFLVWQIRGSQETLAAHIGRTPRYLAYPGGRFDDDVLAIMAELDFWGGLTTEGGWWHGYDDRYQWRRLRVRGTTTLDDFIWLLTAASP